MPKHAPDWEAVRLRYVETDDAVADICRAFGIDKTDLNRRVRSGKWRRSMPRPFPPLRRKAVEAAGEPFSPPLPSAGAPEPAAADDGAPAASKPSSRTSKSLPKTTAARRQLLNRLVAAISLKLEQLERRMAQDLDTAGGADASATDHERETRAIGALIDNLGKVTEMESGLDRSAGKPGAATDIAGEADRWRRELAQRLQRIVGPSAGAS